MENLSIMIRNTCYLEVKQARILKESSTQMSCNHIDIYIIEGTPLNITD